MKYILCNWKNYVKMPDGKELLEIAASFQERNIDCKILLIPDDFHIGYFYSLSLLDEQIEFGAQNVSPDSFFPHTGGACACQLPDQISHILVGHAERRKFGNYTNAVIREKIETVSKYNRGLIYCIGETEKYYDLGKIQSELMRQLEPLSEYNGDNIFVCYEPSWAIGSGHTVGLEVLADLLLYIRQGAEEFSGHENIHMLYGGGIHPDNLAEVLSIPGCDGVLSGSSCVTPEKFTKLLSSIS